MRKGVDGAWAMSSRVTRVGSFQLRKSPDEAANSGHTGSNARAAVSLPPPKLVIIVTVLLEPSVVSFLEPSRVNHILQPPKAHSFRKHLCEKKKKTQVGTQSKSPFCQNVRREKPDLERDLDRTLPCIHQNREKRERGRGAPLHVRPTWLVVFPLPSFLTRSVISRN